jgi:hypothetical protein
MSVNHELVQSKLYIHLKRVQYNIYIYMYIHILILLIIIVIIIIYIYVCIFTTNPIVARVMFTNRSLSFGVPVLQEASSYLVTHGYSFGSFLEILLE